MPILENEDKRCDHCAHCIIEADKCGRVSPATIGDTTPTCLDERHSGPCGLEGSFFEAKDGAGD